MSLSSDAHAQGVVDVAQPIMLQAGEVAEVIEEDEDHAIDSDGEGYIEGEAQADEEDAIEVEFINDSSVYFDSHTDSIFHISQHPGHPGEVFLTGGGDETAYIWAVEDAGSGGGGNADKGEEDIAVSPRKARVLQKLGGHTDSVIGGGWTADGQFVVTAGMDGRVRSWRQKEGSGKPSATASTTTTTSFTLSPATWGGTVPKVDGWEFVSEVHEVAEVSWVEMHPTRDWLALGAKDGSVWVYTLESGGELVVKCAMYNHSADCTAGAWSPVDPGLLVTVSEDGSLYAYDVTEQGKALISLTGMDARWNVEGGWVGVAVNWEGSATVCGGACGTLRVVGLPRSSAFVIPTSTTGRGQRPTPGGSQAGQILATMETHTESVESLSFCRALPLLASASVDGTIIIYDTSRNYSVRKTIQLAHPNPRSSNHQDQHTDPDAVEEEDHSVNSVVKVEFIPSTHPPTSVILTSCGVDGTTKRWDARTGAEICCWRGHSDSIMNFVQTEKRVVTAGDDHVALVFDTPVVGKAVGVLGL